MGTNTKFTGFSEVDNSENPQFFVNCLNEQYATDSDHRINKQRTLQLVDLQVGQIILDAGCGIGLDAIQMAAQVGETGHVFGVDNSQVMITQARSNAAHLHLPLTFHYGNIYQLEFRDNYFDRCRVDNTFQHLSDPKAALKELIRVTKVEGKIIVADPDHDSLIINTPYSEVNHRFTRFRSDHMQQGGIAHQLHGFCKELGLIDVHAEPLTHVFTDYEEKKITSPYLDEIWVAQEHGAVTREEAEKWVVYLRKSIEQDRFMCLQTYIITTAVKPSNLKNTA